MTSSPLTISILDTISLTCNVSGFPFTSIQTHWILAAPTVNDRISIDTITDDMHGYITSTLTIRLFQHSDAGVYQCTASLEGLVGSVLYNLTAGMSIYHCFHHITYMPIFFCIYVIHVHTYVYMTGFGNMCKVHTFDLPYLDTHKTTGNRTQVHTYEIFKKSDGKDIVCSSITLKSFTSISHT